MTRIVVDATMRSRLRDLNEALEFADEEGHVLGHFLPAGANDPWEPQISQEEIDRRLRQGGGRPLAEILADFQKRA